MSQFCMIVVATMSLCQSYAVSLQDLVLSNVACVKEVIGEKLYFHEKALYPSSEGIYIELNNDDNFIVVPEISFDGQGYFLSLNGVVPMEDCFQRPKLHWVCTCGHVNSLLFSRCRSCGKPIGRQTGDE